MAIVDGDMARHGDDSAMAIGLAHGFVEQRGNDAAMRVAGRSLELRGEMEVAEDAIGFVDEEFQAKSGMVVLPAAEAAVEAAMCQRDSA